MAFVQTNGSSTALRFLIGAMEAGFAPGVLYYLTLWFPTAFRGRITSMLFLASAFAGLFGAPAAGLMLATWMACWACRLALAVPGGRPAVRGARRWWC
jgi:MFS family permease